MQMRVFSMSFDPDMGGFDDGPLRDFLVDKRVIEVREHYFSHEQIPQLSVLAIYRTVDAASFRPKSERGKRSHGAGRQDWRATVPEPQRLLFDALRTWRNERAISQGVPAYVMLSNRQVAEIATPCYDGSSRRSRWGWGVAPQTFWG